IDDSTFNQNFLKIVLENEGYGVLIGIDYESGIKIVQNQQVDLILLDVMLPKIDGFEICRLLKSDSQTKDIPIIFMTALSNKEEKVKGLSLGAVDYITKPFQQEEVIARIQVHLKLRRLNLELDRQKQQLEQRVQERTAELSQTLEELKKTQLQLVQREKISLLGQLVAGVAHEVNNPLGFISNNLHYASQYVQDLMNIVKLYQKQFPNPGHEIEEKIAESDLEHTLEDLPKLICSMKLGANRIHGIMQSLRNFSRSDRNKKKAVDIHDGLETTLMILQHRLQSRYKRPTIQVIKEYGNLPQVECYPGQLNQVFMNLLANAIDALEEGVGDREWGIGESQFPTPQIKISTSLNNQQVTIRFTDNGQGMSESVQSNIFNSCFTTKPEGKGTGLGLLISHQIVVEQHGGELNCVSTLGKGTELTLKIPVMLSKASIVV
ncbi:MAG: response regulator, partial [Rhizonema sp. PD37]|nr:response regulator [Rhizonema sp. PD37]